VVEYREAALGSPGCGWWTDILRLHFNHSSYCEAALLEAVPGLDDFQMAGVAWLVNKEWDNPRLSEAVRNSLLARLTSLPWWLDEQGSFLRPDGVDMQYWSENHQMGWYCGQYLVGHAFASRPELQGIIFQGGNLTGRELAVKGRERLMRWLDYRGRFGFSEYNADTYGPIAYAPLITVAALAPDPEVATLARMVATLQLFDWALASHRGVLGSPRGRATVHGKLLEEGAVSQSVHTMLWLLTGQGSIETVNLNRRGAIMTVLGLEAAPGLLHPVLPAVAEEAAHGQHELRERFALSSEPDEAAGEGIGFTEIDDCVFWFGNGAYFSPSTCRCLFLVGDWAGLWDRHPVWQQLKHYGAKAAWDLSPAIIGGTLAAVQAPWAKVCSGQVELDSCSCSSAEYPHLPDAAAVAAESLGGGTVLGPANVYTWRTQAFMLSSVQVRI
jgi:hypothetical protein